MLITNQKSNLDHGKMTLSENSMESGPVHHLDEAELALELELELEDALETAFTTFARRKDMRSSRFSLIEVLTLAMRISSTLSSLRDHWSPPVNDRIIANALSTPRWMLVYQSTRMPA